MATHSSEVDQYNEVEERLRREASLSQLGLLALISNPLSAWPYHFSQAGAGFGIRIILMWGKVTPVT